MKRDMEKVRSVMLALEQEPGPYFLALDPEPLGGVSEVAEYLELLESGGFVGRLDESVFRITWAGHEFIDTVRDPEIWSKTKKGAEKIGTFSLKLLGELAIGFAKTKAAELGLPIGSGN